MRSAIWSSVAALSLLMLSSPAVAQEAPARSHDGFYLRVLAGVSGMHTTTRFDPDPTERNGSMSGTGFGGLLMVGGTPMKGLVVGGGAMGAHIFAPTISVDGEVVEADGAFGAMVLGPFIDYYPDPTAGLHFIVMPGLATLLADGNADTTGGLGVGGVVGLGYEWWIANQWSLGAIARFEVLSTSADAQGIPVRYTTTLPALMLTVAYH